MSRPKASGARSIFRALANHCVELASNMLGKLEAMNQLLLCFKQAHSDPGAAAAVKQMEDKVTSEMESELLQHSSISVADSTAIIKMIAGSSLSLKNRTKVLNTVTPRVDLASAAPASKNKDGPGSGNTAYSSHYSLQNFFTQEQWALISNRVIPEATRCHTLTKTALAIGTCNPCEKTFVHWASILMMAEAPTAHLNPDPAFCHRLTEKLKTHFRTSRDLRRKAKRISGTEPPTGPLPDTPEQLQSASPEKYELLYPGSSADAGLGPVPSPIDPLALEELRVSMPCRTTHHTVAIRKKAVHMPRIDMCQGAPGREK